MNPVVIAAAKFELDPLCHKLQEMGHTPEARLTGVGALNAAKKALKLGDACRGRDVIFVGTCGSFAAAPKKISLVRAKEVLWLPTCERVKLCYTIKDTAPPIQLPEAPAWSKALPDKKVLCTPGISLISTLPDYLSPESLVENLELYSCIAEIGAQAKSLAVILAITNSVGADSHAQWRQNFAEAAGLTAEFIGSSI